MASPPDRTNPTSSQTVVVIDDDTGSLELMSRTLTRLGANVLPASTGEEGLRLARASRPLAIFLDVIMPDMDGWDVLSKIKADPELAGVPVVMATMLDERKKALGLGVTEYLVKPVERSRLAGLLDRLSQVREEEESPAPAVAEAQPTPGPTDGPVLIVEDDKSNREILARLLRKQGLEVVEAENGEQALGLLAEKAPSLILLDLMMPTMDGLTFLDRLRNAPDHSSVPVLVLTSKDLSRDDREQLGGSVRRVFQKGSIKREELLREIGTHCGPSMPTAPIS